MCGYIKKSKRAFSLIEVIIAIFIFSVIMTAAASVLGRSVKEYRYARASQRVLEDAEFAMNRIAKSLRTSSVMSVASNGKNIVIYDYSRNGGACVRYTFMADTIVEEVEPLNYNTDDITKCNASIFTFTTPQALLTYTQVDGQFSAQPSAYKTRVGRVTMAIVAQDNRGMKMYLQTTVSLRDYDVSGLL